MRTRCSASPICTPPIRCSRSAWPNALATQTVADAAQNAPAMTDAEENPQAARHSSWRSREQAQGARAVLPIRRSFMPTAGFLTSEDGPRVAVFDALGWDTHANEGGAQGQLAARLAGLDAGLRMLKEELGSGVARYRRDDRDRIRPHGSGQRHARHGSRHGGGGLLARRRGARRPRDRGLARTHRHARSIRAAIWRRPSYLHSALKGVLSRTPAGRDPGARNIGVPGQRGGKASAGSRCAPEVYCGAGDCESSFWSGSIFSGGVAGPRRWRHRLARRSFLVGQDTAALSARNPRAAGQGARRDVPRRVMAHPFGAHGAT